jgi:hypothetical protein
MVLGSHSFIFNSGIYSWCVAEACCQTNIKQMQKYFTEVIEESPKAVVMRAADEPETVKTLWTDPKTNHTYEIAEKKALGPNADYTMEQRARDIAMQRARQPETRPPERDMREAPSRHVPNLILRITKPNYENVRFGMLDSN